MVRIKSLDGKPANDTFPAFLKFFFIVLLMVGGLYFTYKGFRVKNKTAKDVKKTELLSLKKIPKEIKILADSTIKKTNEVTGVILGEATEFAQNTASKSAEFVTDFVFENTVGAILKQIDKLPEKQKEKIEEYICK